MVAIALLVVFPALMAFAAACDLLTMTIPNKVSLALVGAFAVAAVAAGLPLTSVLLGIGAGALVLVVTFALFSFGWIGGGDAKLAAASALWLGFGLLPEYLYLSALFGGVLTIAVLLLRWAPLPMFASGWTWLNRLHDRSNGVPYGIALAAAALLVFPHSEMWQAALLG